MATSRYDTPGSTAGDVRRMGLTTNSSGTTEGTSNTTGSSSTQGSSSTTQQGTSSTNTQNMTGTSLAALEALIAQLTSGGTPTQQLQSAQRQQELSTLQGNRTGYSRDNAFADAQGLMSQTMRRTLEQLIPGINRASAGAGASQGSMRALLLQRAAETAAENASAQGLQAAVNYGQVANGTSNVIASLINGQQDTITQSLIAALNLARGAVSNSTTNTSSTSDTNSSQNTNSSSNTNTTQQTNQNSNTSVGNGSTGTGGNVNGGTSGNTVLGYFPPAQTTSQVQGQTTGSTLDTLIQLAGGASGNDWSNGFTF